MKQLIILLFILSSISFSSFNTSKTLTEEEKIDALIEAVENLSNARFYRNGSYYNAKAAAAHLQMKREKAGSRIKTAEDFIDKLASKSSYSGKDYMIVYDTGKKVTARSFFYAKLKSLN